MMASSGNKTSSDWQLIFVISGEGKVKDSDGKIQQLKAEDIIAVSPGEKITLEGKLEIMKIMCK